MEIDWSKIIIEYRWVFAAIIIAIILRSSLGGLIERLKKSKISSKDIELLFSNNMPKNLTTREKNLGTKNIETKDIQNILTEAQELCKYGLFEKAETLLVEKEKEDHESFDVFKALFYLYDDPKCELKENKELTKFIKKREKYFADKPEYYRFLAISYMKMRDDIKIGEKYGSIDFDLKEYTIETVKKAIELEIDNPRWKSLLAYTYYWFGDIPKAIEQDERALKLMQSKGGDALDIKNNLAYYYAESGNKMYEKSARDLSTDLFNSNPDSSAHLDTLGYVKWKFAKDTKEVGDASELIEMALRKNPFDPDFNRHFTECLQELKFMEESDKQVEEVKDKEE